MMVGKRQPSTVVKSTMRRRRRGDSHGASSVAIAIMRGDFATVPGQADVAALLWAGATGLSLTVAVSSLFRALALGPASVVVPLYGMFIVGGAALCVVFLNEPLSLKKLVGLTAAVAGAYLVSS